MEEKIDPWLKEEVEKWVKEFYRAKFLGKGNVLISEAFSRIFSVFLILSVFWFFWFLIGMSFINKDIFIFWIIAGVVIIIIFNESFLFWDRKAFRRSFDDEFPRKETREKITKIIEGVSFLDHEELQELKRLINIRKKGDLEVFKKELAEAMKYPGLRKWVFLQELREHFL